MVRRQFIMPSNLWAMLGPRYMVPDCVADSVLKVTSKFLKSRGIKTVLFDMDNTLAEYHGKTAPKDVFRHLQSLKKEFNVAIVSNFSASSDPKKLHPRIRAITETFKVKTIIPRYRKPDRRAFRESLQLFDSKPRETVIVGDRLFTDISGGNRAGLLTVYVKAFDARSEPWYFIALRYLEYLLLGFYILMGIGKKKMREL